MIQRLVFVIKRSFIGDQEACIGDREASIGDREACNGDQEACIGEPPNHQSGNVWSSTPVSQASFAVFPVDQSPFENCFLL